MIAVHKIVYNMFFDVYRVNQQSNRSFVDLLDLLRGYEENTATLIDGQRDHYTHSVNVFILGMCIYSQNQFYRNAVKPANQPAPCLQTVAPRKKIGEA